MPWQEDSIMSLRRDFVAMATQEGTNRRALCRHFGISPTTSLSGGCARVIQAVGGRGTGRVV